MTTVTASDPDSGAVLTYSIVGGADAAKFTINASTGVLSFVSAPDFEAPTDAGANNVYDVQVQVSDGALTDTPDNRGNGHGCGRCTIVTTINGTSVQRCADRHMRGLTSSMALRATILSLALAAPIS